jgi:hypothetical protein
MATRVALAAAFRGAAFADALLVLAQAQVRNPMQAVLDAPVGWMRENTRPGMSWERIPPGS